MTKKFSLSLALIIIAFAAVACKGNRPAQTATPDVSIYAVDSVFREFYKFLGGRAILGSAISSAKDIGNTIQQYTENGLMIFDTTAPANRRFQLGPLGKELGIGWSKSGVIEIAEAFIPLYNRLGGVNFVGRPITGLVYNAGLNRYEQYFENLGFYQGEETSGKARLLPYGRWKCVGACQDLGVSDAGYGIPTPTFLLPPSVTPPGVTKATPELRELSFQVWARLPMVAASQEQEIFVNVRNEAKPVAGVELDLYVTMPNGSTQSYKFPDSDEEGQTRLKVPPIPADNMTDIPYKVCLTSIDAGVRYCIRQSYFIWNRP